MRVSKLRAGVGILAGVLPVLLGPSIVQAAPSGLSVTLTDGKQEVRSDSDVSYEATVRNGGTEPVNLTLVLTVPDYVKVTDASEAKIAGVEATWNVSVDPGKAVTKTASAHISDIPAGQLRVTALASVYEGDPGRVPLIRTADANRIEGVLDPADARRAPVVDKSTLATWSTWLLRIGVPVAALAVLVGVVQLWRRRRGARRPSDGATSSAATAMITSSPPNEISVPAGGEDNGR